MPRKIYKYLLLAFFISFASAISAQELYPVTLSQNLWHGKERELRYKPVNGDFVITNGNRRFTRALYGTNTAFRVETGDLPEFALYMPGMGGNFKFGLISGEKSKWLINAGKTVARYRPGSMIYEIEDSLLGKGKLHLTILALGDAEGFVIKTRFENVTGPLQLYWAFGGASGKKFSRDGDMGPDPESVFYLKPENCKDNRYLVKNNTFRLSYGTGEVLSEEERYEIKHLAEREQAPAAKGKLKYLTGLFPLKSEIKTGDATKLESPLQAWGGTSSPTPILNGRLSPGNKTDYYFIIQNPDSSTSLSYASAATVFQKAESARKKIAERIKISTPDPYINTIGGALSMAADAIWEYPSYMHGSIGWRMRLNGWRGPYTGDPLGWHDRSKAHFEAYALSQVTTPLTGPVVSDTALHLARQLEKLGTSVFSSGYICRNPGGDFRPHHYDMNLVYIDALLSHFKWTGDLALMKKLWPVITRHLDWEKRNFDSDGDGLYDAYASIWASDALQYSGGGVTHSSSYNYRANKIAAEIAALIGADPSPYKKEADKILSAINTILWMPSKGRYAEFKDMLGLKSLHPQAAIWTIYHSIDSDVPDAFQAYQNLRYIDTEIPHIPVKAKDLEEGYYTVSTTNWMPYTWSINNVAMAEVMHTTLANWQAGRSEEAFRLWKSALLESMYIGGSPGNIQQISFYDAIRGETYRDFADPVGMTARSLVEGLFGIKPDLLKDKLTIQPGIPVAWDHASLEIPDVTLMYKRTGNRDDYTILPRFGKSRQLQFLARAKGAGVKSVKVNGKEHRWRNVDSAVGNPQIEINCSPAAKYIIQVEWEGDRPTTAAIRKIYALGDRLETEFPGAAILNTSDPQKAFEISVTDKSRLKATIGNTTGNFTVFVQLKQGSLTWWHPLCFEVKSPVSVEQTLNSETNNLEFTVTNNLHVPLKGKLTVEGFSSDLALDARETSKPFTITPENLVPGSNAVKISTGDKNIDFTQNLVAWNEAGRLKGNAETVDLSGFYNDRVTNIFKNKYLSPRPAVPTLQLPIQGIGDWCYPLKTASIDDAGLRKLAGQQNRFVLPQGIPFSTPGDSLEQNIMFTSQWDNFPRERTVPLTGSASHAYFLMAGSTNPMQSRFDNGVITIRYSDGSADSLVLRNPETWWPIEQDYLEDGFAFTTGAPVPVRVHLKTGLITTGKSLENNGKVIDGGAATVLDLPLDPSRTLRSVTLKTLANDVVIGLMAVTLIR